MNTEIEDDSHGDTVEAQQEAQVPSVAQEETAKKVDGRKKKERTTKQVKQTENLTKIRQMRQAEIVRNLAAVNEKLNKVVSKKKKPEPESEDEEEEAPPPKKVAKKASIQETPESEDRKLLKFIRAIAQQVVPDSESETESESESESDDESDEEEEVVYVKKRPKKEKGKDKEKKVKVVYKKVEAPKPVQPSRIPPRTQIQNQQSQQQQQQIPKAYLSWR
jgi:rRNA-processing protein EBP2